LPRNILPEAAEKGTCLEPKLDPRLERLQREIADATTGMTAEQWIRHPAGKWCAAEVLEHLYLTYTGTIKGFERVLAAGEPRHTGATWRQRVGKLVVLGFGHMPGGREAPAMARPKGIPPEKVRTEIAGKIDEMDDLIRQCEEKWGTRRPLMDHLILGPLSGAQWRKFHLVHGLHHVRQIRGLREASGVD
jgi:hypothetical protein